MHYLYSRSIPVKPDKATSIVMAIFFGAFTFVPALLLCLFATFEPKPIDLASYDSGIVIEDHLSMIENQNLGPSMMHFMEVSGISPAVEVVGDWEWEDNYSSLETFALSEYLRMFSDEKHWLVVVSYPDDYETADFVDWSWEGVIGDDCGETINSDSEELFTRTVQSWLLRSDNTNMDRNLASAYEEFTAVCMTPHTSNGFYVGAVVATLIGVAIIFAIYREYCKDVEGYSATRVAKNAKEMNCLYCERMYVTGTVSVCPGCGAPIPAYNPEEANG